MTIDLETGLQLIMFIIAFAGMYLHFMIVQQGLNYYSNSSFELRRKDNSAYAKCPAKLKHYPRLLQRSVAFNNSACSSFPPFIQQVR